MKYRRFIEDVKMGHEFVGEICNKKMSILNVLDDEVVICIDGEVKLYRYDDIESVVIYYGMTFRMLFDTNQIKIYEIF